MRILRCALVFAVALAFVSNSVWAQLPSNELEGTWKMVKQQRVYPDSTVDHSEKWGAGFKILNSTHFAWGRETEDGTKVLAGGGWYEYHPEKNRYVEHVQYHSDPGFAGQTLRFTAKVEGDTWIHVGDLGHYKLREVWKRVDPETVGAEMAKRASTSNSEQPDGQ